MKKLLLVILICLFQTGCMFYFEGDGGSSRDDRTEYYNGYDSLWIEYGQVNCDQGNGYYPTYWYLEAIVSASYNYYASELDVGVFVDGSQYYSLDYRGHDLWTLSLRSNNFMYCNDIAYFNFVAEDEFGNYDELIDW